MPKQKPAFVVEVSVLYDEDVKQFRYSNSVEAIHYAKKYKNPNIIFVRVVAPNKQIIWEYTPEKGEQNFMSLTQFHEDNPRSENAGNYADFMTPPEKAFFVTSGFPFMITGIRTVESNFPDKDGNQQFNFHYDVTIIESDDVENARKFMTVKSVYTISLNADNARKQEAKVLQAEYVNKVPVRLAQVGKAFVFKDV